MKRERPRTLGQQAQKRRESVLELKFEAHPRTRLC
jgi:hypothetical protein